MDEVAADGGINDLLQFVESDDNIPSTSAPLSMSVPPIHQQHLQHHQPSHPSPAPKPMTTAMPVNTTGKEPKGKEKAFANSRRKRDMVIIRFIYTFILGYLFR